MRRFLWIPVCARALIVPVVVLAGGGEGGFNGVVDSIESHYHVHATPHSLSWLDQPRMARKSTHGGVGSLHVAEIEHFSGDIDGQELNQLVEEKLGAGWERIIRETSRTGGEQTLIFMRPEGSRMGLFIVDKDREEMNVVQVSVDPDHLQDSIGKYSHHHSSG